MIWWVKQDAILLALKMEKEAISQGNRFLSRDSRGNMDLKTPWFLAQLNWFQISDLQNCKSSIPLFQCFLGNSKPCLWKAGWDTWSFHKRHTNKGGNKYILINRAPATSWCVRLWPRVHLQTASCFSHLSGAATDWTVWLYSSGCQIPKIFLLFNLVSFLDAHRWTLSSFAKAVVPNLWDLMLDGLRWSWFNNNRNKGHRKCNALESSGIHCPTPSPWKNCLPWSQSLVPKRLGTTVVKNRLKRVGVIEILKVRLISQLYHSLGLLGHAFPCPNLD